MNRSHDETSEALLAAAHRLLAESGTDSLTVRRIATEAGMSTMNVYSRFGGKDGVIDELFADGYRRLGDALGAVPVTDDIRGDLLKISHTYRDFALANPTYYGIMLRGTVHGFEPSESSAVVALTSLKSVVTRIAAGLGSGDIFSSEIDDSIEIAGLLWATCHGLVSLELRQIENFGSRTEQIASGQFVSWPSTFEHGIRAMISALCSERVQSPTV